MQILSGCVVFVISTVVADRINVFSESANTFFFFFFFPCLTLNVKLSLVTAALVL